MIVQRRFGGSREQYLGALRRARASTALALGAIADELRREALLVRLRATTPTAAEVAEFAATYASVQLRDIPGTGAVPGVDAATPLGLLPDELARPAIVRRAPARGARRALRGVGRAAAGARTRRDPLHPRPPADGRDRSAHELDAVPGASRGSRVGASTATTVPLPAPLAR